MKRVLNNKTSIDDESSLFNLDKKYDRFLPKLINKIEPSIQQRTQTVPDLLERIPLSTRERKPCNPLSGITINRFENVKGYQDVNKIVFNESIRGGMNSRQIAKDKFNK